MSYDAAMSPFCASKITEDGYYWYWDVDGWGICSVYQEYMHFDDGSGEPYASSGLWVIGPLQEPKGTPMQFAQWAEDRKERQKWGIPE